MKTGDIIDLDEADYIQDRRRRINGVKIMDAVFLRGGKIIAVPDMVRTEFRFTGLSTIDFVEFHDWG